LRSWKIPSIPTIIKLLDALGEYFSPNLAFVEAYCANFNKDTLKVVDRVLNFVSDSQIASLFKNALHVATARQCAWIVQHLLDHPNDTLRRTLLDDMKSTKKTRVAFCKASVSPHMPMHCLFHKGNADAEEMIRLLNLFLANGLDVNLPAADGKTRCLNIALTAGHSTDWLAFLLNALLDRNMSFSHMASEIEWNNLMECFAAEKPLRERILGQVDLRTVCCYAPQRIDLIWELTNQYNKLPMAQVLREFMKYSDCGNYLNYRQPTGMTPLLAVACMHSYQDSFKPWQLDTIACFLVAGAQLTDQIVIGGTQMPVDEIAGEIKYLEWCKRGHPPPEVLARGRKLLGLD